MLTKLAQCFQMTQDLKHVRKPSPSRNTGKVTRLCNLPKSWWNSVGQEEGRMQLLLTSATVTQELQRRTGEDQESNCAWPRVSTAEQWCSSLARIGGGGPCACSQWKFPEAIRRLWSSCQLAGEPGRHLPSPNPGGCTHLCWGCMVWMLMLQLEEGTNLWSTEGRLLSSFLHHGSHWGAVSGNANQISDDHKLGNRAWEGSHGLQLLAQVLFWAWKSRKDFFILFIYLVNFFSILE